MKHQYVSPCSPEKTLYRQAFIDFIKERPNAYHLTITFRKGCSDKVCESTFNEIIKRLNQRMISRRYLNGDIFINAFVVRERQANGTLHYHSVISDEYGNLKNKAKLEDALSKIMPKMIKGMDSNRQTRLIGEDGYLLQIYKNDGTSKLERYLTKNLEAPNWQEAIDSLGFWGKDRAYFGDAPLSRRAANDPKYY